MARETAARRAPGGDRSGGRDPVRRRRCRGAHRPGCAPDLDAPARRGGAAPPRRGLNAVEIGPEAQEALIAALRRVAAAEILPRFRRLGAGDLDTKSGPDDLVTVADRAAEAAIAEAVRAILPGAEVVGEEAVAADPALLDRIAAAEVCAIVDPVDGTANFAHGLATFGVILAVAVRGRTVLGVLYDPIGDDWIVAGRGQGAWFGRPGAPPRRLTGPTPAQPEAARVYLPLSLYRAEDRPAVARTMAGLGHVAALRCSCHEYRQLALGHAHALVTPMLKPWDHAAGVLVVEECGGAACLADGGGYGPTRHAGHMAVAGDAATARALLARLPAR
ncbi:inositol monophosphatase [Rhodobacteraceae bacterium CCMM004]|nr:inositol monophosphatase [Rhodobacteraceae bacterium CCMM004]